MTASEFTFAHLADAHVGAWPRNPPLRDRLRESVLRAIEVARERDAQFLLVSGDLFHTPVPDPAEVAPVAAQLRRFVADGRRVYVVYGSHDYVAHRTSWLDVLSEAGVFVRVAPEAVRAEGEPWSLPWIVDEPTGALIAGVSGRSHGLDREYFRSMDSSGFAAASGFKIFQFHAGIEEYLPPHLREKIRGLRLEDLPRGCDYYAGGHIHYSYEGPGPDGGYLVNPGAVFGTSRTDIENGEAGRTHRGLVLVRVARGRPSVSWVDTIVPGGIRTIDVDVTGHGPEAVNALILARVQEANVARGTLILPRLHGQLTAGGGFDVTGARATLLREGLNAQIDARDVEGAPDDPGTALSETAVEELELARLLGSTENRPAFLHEEAGERVVRELLRELGTPKAEGESALDYLGSRRAGARRILGVPPDSTA
jgi:exonuclease SbcD